jgi:subtilisin family serine protease
MALGKSTWFTRGTLPLLAALAVAPVCALPAAAKVSGPASVAQDASRKAAAPGLTAEWWLEALNAQRAWRAAPEQGAGVTVAVLSTGVDPKQPDLTGNVVTGPDYSESGRSQGNPLRGTEGTAAASLIAGHGHGTAGTQGITGVAPRARILSVRVTLDYGDPLISNANVTRHLPDAIARGIEYAVSHGAQVIALPLDPATLSPSGTPSPAAGGSAAEQAAVRDALAHNVVLVAPAGDDAISGDTDYPAAYPGVIAVGATASGGQLAVFSSTRSYVALTAPGVGLTVAAPDGGYTTLSTTDMAAALTAGVAALARSRYPWLTAAQITRSLEFGVTPANPKSPGTGAGALNAAGTVTAAAGIYSLIANPAQSPAPAWGTYVTNPHEAAASDGSGFLGSSVLRDAVTAAGTLIALLAIAGMTARWRRRRAGRTSRGSGSAARTPRHRKSAGGSHARDRVQHKPDTPASVIPAPVIANPGSPAARASTADTLISRNPASVHPPWEVAERLGVTPEAGVFPRVPAPGSGPM